MPERPLRIFVPSGAGLLTDSEGHGEGLLAWRTLAGLARRGHDLVVCARSVDLAASPPFETIETGPASARESLEPLAYARRAEKLFRSLGGPARFDLAHWLFPQGAEQTLFAPEPAIPYVIGPHSLAWPAPPRRATRAGDAVRAAARPLFRARRSRALAAASALLVDTPAAAAVLPAALRARARVVPWGVDVTAFDPAPLPSAPSVLFVGSLSERKGVRELVPAFARARAALGGATLVLAGDGELRPWVEAEGRRLGLDGSLAVAGPVPHGEVPALMAGSSLVCLPSRGEPFGMTVLEAMAAGRAVVACDAGGPRYLVDGERGGRLVAPGDVGGLADALVELLADPAGLERMGAFNRGRAERSFSLQRTLDALEGVYAEALA